MEKNNSEQLNFLTLNNILDEVISFTKENDYQEPKPTLTRIKIFYHNMQDLMILLQQLPICSDQQIPEKLTQIASLYSPTKHDLYDLLYATPEPNEAAGWFDYQHEFNARENQIENLSLLITWHKKSYENLITIYPQLMTDITIHQVPPETKSYLSENSQLMADEYSTEKYHLPNMIID